MGIQSLPPNAGTSRIKKRIRDTERLLAKPGLAATKKSEAERALASFKSELSAAEHRKVEIKNAKKYHLVKFVEKKKTFRLLKKPDAGDDALAAWYYVTTYPKEKKYRALYAGEEKFSKDTHPYLREVYQKMESGELARGSDAIKHILKNTRV